MPRRIEEKATEVRENIYKASSITKGLVPRSNLKTTDNIIFSKTAKDLNRHFTRECLELGKEAHIVSR